MEHNVDRSRIPHFYKMSVDERVKAVRERGLLNEHDYRALLSGEHTLKLSAADKMIENPVTIQLRYLQTMTEISADNTSTIVFPLPIDLISAYINKKAE